MATPAPDRADVLVIGNTSHLRVLDRYQRSVPSPREVGIIRHAPIVIRNARDLLSDGFTHCARVEVNGEVFFFIRGSDSRLVGADSFGYQALYRRSSILGDTVEVQQGLLIQSVRRTESSHLSTGERLERLFVHEGLTYVRRLTGGQKTFGWVALTRSERGSLWRVITTVPPPQVRQTAQLMSRVTSVVQEANAVLAGLFSFLNQQTGEDRGAPRWEISQVGNAIICTLRSEIPSTSFRETTTQLARSLEPVVLATRHRIVAQPGRIELR